MSRVGALVFCIIVIVSLLISIVSLDSGKEDDITTKINNRQLNENIFLKDQTKNLTGDITDENENVPEEREFIQSNTTAPVWPLFNTTIENIRIIQERNESEQVLIDNVAYRGDAVRDYRISLREMNLFMRKNYDEMIHRVGHNIYPLIVANEVQHDKKLPGTGNEYILFLRNGSIYHIKPTPVEYEQNKNLAHIPMSIFAIISPYFNHPTSQMWHEKLSQLHEIILQNIDALNFASSSGSAFTENSLCKDNLSVEDHKTMLAMADEYITLCFERNSVDVGSFKKFAASYLPLVEKAMTCASQIQARAAVAELMKWKRLLGPKLWRELYVVIPVVWPVARVNPRQQIFEKLMDEDRIETHILKAEGARSVDEARVIAGRIIADRSMAHFVFGYKYANHTDMNLALSTRRDLISSRTAAVLAEDIEKYQEEAPDIVPNDINFQNDY